jgi:hypothetical protein
VAETWFREIEDGDFNVWRDLGVFVAPARNYVLRRWYNGPTGRIEKDDLVSHAHVVLVELANAKHGEFHEHPGRFWAAIKQSIDWRIQRVVYEREGRENVRSDHYQEIEEDPEFTYSQLRVRQEYSLVQVALCDAIAVLPRRHKIVLALRFFEQHSLAKMGGMIGAKTNKAPFNYVTALCAYLLWYAKCEVSDRGILERPPLPKIADQYIEPLEVAAADSAAAYGMDSDEWLGWVQRCYLADVSYLLDIMDTGNGHMIHYVQPRVDRAADVAYVESMEPAPQSIAELKERTGWGWPRCEEAIAVWRRAHGIEAPKNGNAVRAA